MDAEQRNAVEGLLVALRKLTERAEKLSRILEEMSERKNMLEFGQLKFAEGVTPEMVAEETLKKLRQSRL